MATVVTGLFHSPAAAAHAVHELEARGVSQGRISLIASEGFEKDRFAIDTHSKMSEGVALGATTGAAAGALIAGLTAVGAVVTGGLGLIVAGPLVAALAGAGAGAAGGGVLGGLIGVAIPEHEVKHYEKAIEEGAVMIGVECRDGDQKDLVLNVFKNCDADKVSHA